MQDFSLLFPKNEDNTTLPLTDEAINDLSVDFICDALTEDAYEKNLIKKIMTQVTGDAEVIRYRGEIFDDFYNFPQLRNSLNDLVAKLADLKEIERFQKDSDASALWSLINRLREIDEYVSCVTQIKSTLENLKIKSRGMKELRKIVTDIYNDSGFPQLKKDIDETLSKAQKLKSVTIGVNLDKLLRPKNAGVLSLNDAEFGNPGVMKHFMKFVDSRDDLHSGTDIKDIKSFHPANPVMETNGVTGADPLSDALKKTVSDILKKTVKDIKSTLKKYVNISGYALISLMPEIIFYIRWAELTDKIKAKGLPMAKAEITTAEERNCSFKEIYNLKLAIKAVQGESIDIITNDVDFNEEHRIFILTGPNRGGKTTLTQAVGLGVLMAQWGIYVPASKGIISPCDNIYTHFPADENNTVDLGRLGEEAKRLSEIFQRATGKSMLLLNESLATTNVAEGLYIARDVVKAMRYLGVRAIFNTHMHDLAKNLDEINSLEGKSKVASMITGIADGQRSFKVSIAPPQGVSYARDIAKKYGVTFEQIKNKIKERKQ